ncbi:PREDICTED: intermediate filament tail domain-containing protein 1 [Odobenus rosmarus divergens]|uniref:Intermediate filament tail domain-containing protein 1 n=1 Tax=Odobenus rosmarus divergens TaxID=9708 RepID=A0A9B0M1J3_ODORO
MASAGFRQWATSHMPLMKCLSSFKGVSSSIMTKRQALLLAAQTPVTGEGEDYFQSLFGDSKKLLPHSFHAEKAWKHFSMILEEVGQSRSSALGDVKIAEVNVKGLFVKLINSSLDKELEIGGHILQQNVNGQTVSLYRFPPNIIMQANCTITVWAAASEAKHQPPSDFLWREQNKFRTSPNCTTILCKPNGEAVAWYTPIHWKQAWEKLETDIEFDRCSVVSTTSRRHMLNWPAAITTTKEKQDKCNKDISKYQMERVRVFLKREKETPPNPLPNSSPWCHSPSVPAHPYGPLIETSNTCMTESSLDRQPRPQSSRPDPAQVSQRDTYSNGELKDVGLAVSIPPAYVLPHPLWPWLVLQQPYFLLEVMSKITTLISSDNTLSSPALQISAVINPCVYEVIPCNVTSTYPSPCCHLRSLKLLPRRLRHRAHRLPVHSAPVTVPNDCNNQVLSDSTSSLLSPPLQETFRLQLNPLTSKKSSEPLHNIGLLPGFQIMVYSSLSDLPPHHLSPQSEPTPGKVKLLHIFNCYKILCCKNRKGESFRIAAFY